jgi:Uncharacterized low-complexity proteins
MNENINIQNIIKKIVSCNNKETDSMKEEFFEIEKDIINNLKYGCYWEKFERNEFEVIEGRLYKSYYFKFNDGKEINCEDFWSNGVGKLKIELLNTYIKSKFLTKYNNFSGSKLIGIHFNETKVNLFKVISNDYNQFQHSRLQDFNFKFANFFNCTFKNVFISSNMLNKCEFNDCEFYDCNEKRPEDQLIASEIIKETIIRNSKFINCDFSNFYLNNTKFLECYFEESAFGFTEHYNSSFINSEFVNSVLWKSNLIHTYIDNCKLINTDLQDCKFSLSVVKNTIFSKCDLRRARFENCYLFEAMELRNEESILTSFDENRNRFEYCLLNSTDFLDTIAYDTEYQSNQYDYKTKFSLTCYEDCINKYLYKKQKDEKLTKNELKILSKIENTFKLNNLKKCISLYHNLFVEYKSTNMLDIAYEYYFAFKCLELRKNKIEYEINKTNFKGLRKRSNELFKIKYQKFMYKLCGFGERPLWVFKQIVKLILICAILYMFFGIGNSNFNINYMEKIYRLLSGNCSIGIGTLKRFTIDLATSVYFSIITFSTVGYGDYAPTSPASKVVVSFQVFISLLYASTFTATFIRKALRD